MNSERELVERAARAWGLSDPSFEALLRRRDVKRRRARISAAVMAAVLAIASIALVTQAFGPRTDQPASERTWSRVPGPAGMPADQGFRGVVSWNGMYVAAGWRTLQNGSAPDDFVTSIFSSTDGVHWAQRAVFDRNAFVFRLESDGQRLIAAGFDERGGAVWVSDDASTWKRVSLGGSDVKVFGVAIVGSDYFAWSLGEMWISSDALTWQAVPHADVVFALPALVSGIVAGGPGYVAWGVGGSNDDGGQFAGLWTSRDGTSWTRVPPQASLGGEGSGVEVIKVLETDDGLIAFGAVEDGDVWSRAAWTSTDGLTWTRTTEVRGDVSFSQMITLESGFVAAGGGIWTSPDGLSWTEEVPSSEVPSSKKCFLAWLTDGPAGIVAVALRDPCFWTTAPVPDH